MSKKISIGLLVSVLVFTSLTGSVSAQTSFQSKVASFFSNLFGLSSPESDVAAVGTTSNTPSAIFTLISKSIVTSGYPQQNGVGANISTSTITATFNVKVKAVGGQVIMRSGPLSVSTFRFARYVNGIKIASDRVVPTVSFSIPTRVSKAGLENDAFSIANGQEVTIPVVYQIQGRFPNGSVISPGGITAIALDTITWERTDGVGYVDNSMSGNPKWRTSNVSFEGSSSATPLSVSCIGTPNSTTSVAWASTVSGGSSPYIYSWSTNNAYTVIKGSLATADLMTSYAIGGKKDMLINITDATGRTAYNSCSVTLAPTANQPSITVLSPNGGEFFRSGDLVKITWRSNGSIDFVNISLCHESNYDESSGICSGGGWIKTVARNTGNYEWLASTMGNLIGSGGDKFRVSISGDYGAGSVSDKSDKNFSIYSDIHAADVNRDYKIDENELSYFINLYNYRSGSVRTGEYHTKGVPDFSGYFVAGPGEKKGLPHTADINRDWKISLVELTRVIELKNSAGYKIQAGTEDGFAPIVATSTSKPSITTLSPNYGGPGTWVAVAGSGFKNSSSTVLVGDNVSEITPSYINSAGTELRFTFATSTLSLFPASSYSVRVSNVGNVSVASNRASNALMFYITGTATSTTPVTPTTVTPISPPSVYHSADYNKDWRIDQNELDYMTTLYNYRSGNVRLGDYYCRSGQPGGFAPGVGDRTCYPHSADTNKDWKISLSEFVRVVSLKNAKGGYTVKTGTGDGFAPVLQSSSGSQLQSTTTSPASNASSSPSAGTYQTQPQTTVPTLSPTSAPATTPATSSTVPSITMISPNGGENIRIGSRYIIKWSSRNVSESIHIMLADSSGNESAYIKSWLPAGTTEYIWTVEDFYPSLVGRNLKILIKSASGSAKDISDSTITFSASSASESDGESNLGSPVISFEEVMKLLQVLR